MCRGEVRESRKEPHVKKWLPLIIPVLLIASLPVATAGPDPAGPASLRRTAHRQFLPIVQRRYLPPQPCWPAYGEREFLLQIDNMTDHYEAFPSAADLNGDGLQDIIVDRTKYLTYQTYALDILLNDGQGGILLATSSIFSGTVPHVQNRTQIVVDDYNGDGRLDIFAADHGYDEWPFPGYQNTLVLSTPDGKLVDATGNLPQQYDFTHSACAADIDADGDVDLYTGNYFGQNSINPQILLNDGRGRFTVADQRLPALTELSQNGFTACLFCDVNNDGSPDLILGDGNQHSTAISRVLLNDGAGVFSELPGALPPKRSAADISHHIEPFDLNLDGFPDLLQEYRTPQHASYIVALVNRGDGTFRDETAVRMEPFDRVVWAPHFEMRDINRDGAPDILSFPWDPDQPDPILFVNDGHGSFRRESFSAGLEGGDLYFAFIDLEGDGGHDLLLTLTFPPDRVYVVRDSGCHKGD
jgi:hypothetical protein